MQTNHELSPYASDEHHIIHEPGALSRQHSERVAAQLNKLKADLATSEGDSHFASEEDDDIHSGDVGPSSSQQSLSGDASTPQHRGTKTPRAQTLQAKAKASYGNSKASPPTSGPPSSAASSVLPAAAPSLPSSSHSRLSAAAAQPLQSRASMYRRQASASSAQSYEYSDEQIGSTAPRSGEGLSRAKSVSSVSSINSTSSMEAAPFRAAPLGNVRVGFGGRLMNPRIQHSHFDADQSLSQAGTPSPRLEAPDNTRLRAATTTAASGVGSQAIPATAPIAGSSKSRLLPKAPSDDWHYRTAPGLSPRGGITLNTNVPGSSAEYEHSSIDSMYHNGLSSPDSNVNGEGNASRNAQKPRPSIRSKLAKRAGKLGLKPLTTVPNAGNLAGAILQKSDSRSTENENSDTGTKSYFPISPAPQSLAASTESESPRPISSVTNAPLVVPKNPPGPPFSGPPPSPGLTGLAATSLYPGPLTKLSPKEHNDNPVEELASSDSVSSPVHKDTTINIRPSSIGSGLNNIVGAVLGSNRNSAGSFARPSSIRSQSLRSSPVLTPAQKIQVEARAGLATLPAEPSGASPGPDDDVSEIGEETKAMTNSRPVSGSTITAQTARSGKAPANRLSGGATTNGKQNGSPTKVLRPGLLRAITSESLSRLSLSSSQSESAAGEHSSDRSRFKRRGSVPSQAHIKKESSPLSKPANLPSDSALFEGVSERAKNTHSNVADASIQTMSKAPPMPSLGAPKPIKEPFDKIDGSTTPSDLPSLAVSTVSESSRLEKVESEKGPVRDSARVVPIEPPKITSTQLSVPGQPRGSTPATTNRTARTRNDFWFGDTIGEGSYSTVIEAWDVLPLREKGIEIPSQGKDGSNNAMDAIAGKGKQRTPKAVKESANVYAIKVLDKIHILKEKKQKYVSVEKEALSLLTRHPGVITLYWTFQDRDSLYFVLELAPNGELLGFIKKLGSFNEECVRYYAAQLLDTIEAIHKAGVLHRDVKPENILLDSNMRMRITDFGSAKVIKLKDGGSAVAPTDSGTRKRASSFVGTAEYVSPELLTDKAVSQASDYWAFACIVYQMIVGRPPFKGASEYQTFQKIMRRDFEFQDGFPASAKDMVDKLLNLDPEQRPHVEELRKHPFFESVDWATIWTKTAPQLQPGLYKRVASQEPSMKTMSTGSRGSFGDGIESESGISHHRQASEPSSCVASITGESRLRQDRISTSSEVDADADNDESSLSDAPQGGFRKRGFSAGASAAERMLNTTRKSGGNLLNKVAAGLASLDRSETSSSTSRSNRAPGYGGTGLNMHRFATQVNSNFPGSTGPTAARTDGAEEALSTMSWAALLLPQESLLYACPVLHKTNATLLRSSSKRRQLLLTDLPRLLCVKETNDQLKVKSEVILGIPNALLVSNDSVDGSRRFSQMRNGSFDGGFVSPAFLEESARNKAAASMRRQSSAGPMLSLAGAVRSTNEMIRGASFNGSAAAESATSPTSSAKFRVSGDSQHGAPADELPNTSPSTPTSQRHLSSIVSHMSPNVMTSVEVKSNRAFVVHTPAQSYHYEDPMGDAQHWVESINMAARRHSTALHATVATVA